MAMMQPLPDSNISVDIMNNELRLGVPGERPLVAFSAEQAKVIADFINKYHQEQTVVTHSFKGPSW